MGQAKPGNIEDSRKIIRPLFSNFLRREPDVTETYFRYWAFGKSKQTARSLLCQISAPRDFDGRSTFANTDPASPLFIHGAKDQIVHPRHAEDLLNLSPTAQHQIIPTVGHMVNLELPTLFDPRRSDYGQ